MIKRLNEVWLSLNNSLFILFYMFILPICSLKKLPIIFYFIFLIAMIYRMIYRYKRLNEFRDYSLEDNKQASDRKIRGYQFADFSIIIITLGVASGNIEIINQSMNSLLTLAKISAIPFLILTYGSIITNNILLRVFAIISSTAQGLIAILILFLRMQMRLASIIGMDSPDIKFGTGVCEFLIGVGYILQRNPEIITVVVIASILLNVILITWTPVYQQEQLNLSFKMVTIVIALCGVISFFKLSTMELNIMEYINNNIHDIENKRGIFGGLEEDFIIYCKGYSKSSISNLFYLLLLPYTFGILIVNLVLDFVKRNNLKKMKASMKVLDELGEDSTSPKFEYYMKKYLYFGGDKWRYEVNAKLNNMKKLILSYNTKKIKKCNTLK